VSGNVSCSYTLSNLFIISGCLVAPPRFFLGAFFSLAVGQSAKLGHLFPSSDWPKFPNLAGLTRVKILVSHPADLKSQTPLRVQLPPRRETRRARLGKMAVSINCFQRFISVGCNRTPNAADWSTVSGRIAFGAYNAVALWTPEVSDSLQERVDEFRMRDVWG